MKSTSHQRLRRIGRAAAFFEAQQRERDLALMCERFSAWSLGRRFWIGPLRPGR